MGFEFLDFPVGKHARLAFLRTEATHMKFVLFPYPEAYRNQDDCIRSAYEAQSDSIRRSERTCEVSSKSRYKR